MAEEAERSDVTFLAWCLMSNHIHLIAEPKQPDSLARAIGEAHRRYTRMKNFAEGVRGYLFQGRFGSCVLDQHHLLAASRSILLTAGAALLGDWIITLDPIFSGLAWAIIFGVFASTAFTLVVIPVVYWLIYGNKAEEHAKRFAP